jgi:cytochrome bd ubiquinol oxidase subunit II
MEILWFCLVAFMIAGYVLLDGYDLGTGTIHLSVARTDEERRQVLRTIGPVWDGNEVWLLAGGGTLFFAFPGLYASSFSGFYLPLMIVLWLLMLRGISIELRSHIDNSVWKPFWDVVFACSSALLCIFFGAALGNVIRGVPLDANADFFLPLFTDFQVGPRPGILDWYTVSVALLALFTLVQHGALWVCYRTGAPINVRAHRVTRWALFGAVLLTIIVTIATWSIQPQVPANMARYPWGWVFPACALGGLAGVAAFERRGEDLKALLSSGLYILGMLTSAAFGIFPYVLPSSTDPKLGLTIYNTISGEHGLRVGLRWWIPGMILALCYVTYVHVKFSGKVEERGAGY